MISIASLRFIVLGDDDGSWKMADGPGRGLRRPAKRMTLKEPEVPPCLECCGFSALDYKQHSQRLLCSLVFTPSIRMYHMYSKSIIHIIICFWRQITHVCLDSRPSD